MLVYPSPFLRVILCWLAGVALLIAIQDRADAATPFVIPFDPLGYSTEPINNYDGNILFKTPAALCAVRCRAQHCLWCGRQGLHLTCGGGPVFVIPPTGHALMTVCSVLKLPLLTTLRCTPMRLAPACR